MVVRPALILTEHLDLKSTTASIFYVLHKLWQYTASRFKYKIHKVLVKSTFVEGSS